MIRKILSGSFANLISIFAIMVAALMRSALGVRYLPVVEAGVWFIFLNVITLISFCDFGLSPTLSREIGFSFKEKDFFLQVSNLFSTVRRLINIVSLIAIFFLSCFGYFYLRHLPIDTLLLRQVLYAFILFSLGILIQFQANPHLAVIYGIGNVATERYIRAIGPLVGMILSILLVMKFHYGLYGLITGYLLQTVLIYVLSKYFLHKSVKLMKSGRFLKEIFKRIWEPSLQWALMSIGATLIFQISNFVIASILGIQYVSQFAVLFQIVMVVATIAGIIGYVITPFVAQAKGRGDFETIQSFLFISARASTAIGIVLGVFFYFFVNPVIKIWLGTNFVVNHHALVLLLIMIMLEVHQGACATITMAAGYVKFAMIALIAGLLNLVLSFLFIKLFGIVGAALAIFIAQILTNNWYVLFVTLKKLRISFIQYLIAVIKPLLIFLSIIVLLGVGAKFGLEDIINPYKQLFFATSIMGLSGLFFTWLLVLSDHERQFIKLKIGELFNV